MKSIDYFTKKSRFNILMCLSLFCLIISCKDSSNKKEAIYILGHLGNYQKDYQLLLDSVIVSNKSLEKLSFDFYAKTNGPDGWDNINSRPWVLNNISEIKNLKLLELNNVGKLIIRPILNSEIKTIKINNFSVYKTIYLLDISPFSFRKLEDFSISGAVIPDKTMESINDFKSLKSLYFENSQVDLKILLPLKEKLNDFTIVNSIILNEHLKDEFHNLIIR